MKTDNLIRSIATAIEKHVLHEGVSFYCSHPTVSLADGICSVKVFPATEGRITEADSWTLLLVRNVVERP